MPIQPEARHHDMGLWDGVLASPTKPAPALATPVIGSAPAKTGGLWGASISNAPAAQTKSTPSSSFSFNPVLNPVKPATPPPQSAQPGIFSRIGSAIGNFFSPQHPDSTIPASLYDQASAAVSRHIFENYQPDTNVSMAKSTPMIAPPGTTDTLDLVKGLGQGIARIPAEFAITAGQAGLSLADMAGGTNNLIKSDTGVPTTGMEWLFGDQPITGYGTKILNAADAIKNSPFAQHLGLDKYSLPLAFAGVIGGESLNFTGAGGEEAAIEALVRATDIGHTTMILRRIGVAEDLLPDLAPRIAQMKDAASIKDALHITDTLQRTTKLTSAISARPTEAVPQGLADARASLAENLKTATSDAKRGAIQSQIDLIDQKLAEQNRVYTESHDLGNTAAQEKPTPQEVSALDRGRNSEVPRSTPAIAERGGASNAQKVETEWQQAGFATKKEYEAALKDVASYGESPKQETVRQILAGKITFKPSPKDASEWKAILGNRYYKVFKKDATLHVDEKASELGYDNAEDLKNDVADEAYRRYNEAPAKAPRKQSGKMRTLTESINEPDAGLPKGSTVGEGTQASLVENPQPVKIQDNVPMPPTVGELLSNRARQPADPGHAIPPTPRETALHEMPQEAPRTSDQIPSTQHTTQKVDLSIQGKPVEQRVRSAIGRSQAIGTQIINKGQEAYLAGKGLSNADLAIIRDGYQAGKPIEEIAKKTANPTQAMDLMRKMTDYYDFELAADRAAGGDTARVERYIPQYWDLSNPIDAARWDELAKQKGIKPYYGFRSQSKVFKSYAEGIAAGFTPARSNILEDMKANYEAASHAISRQALKRGLKEAAPDMVGMSGYGMTAEGKPFVNSNVPGLEGLSYHPAIDRLLQGFQPLRSKDFIALVQKSGAEAALNHVGVMGQIDKMVAMAKSAPANAKEAGLSGVLGSIYDHVSGPMKQVLWNWSGFHSINITLSHMGASILHPITGAKGVVQSVGSAVSERVYRATVDSYKALMVAKDASGAEQSVFDWAVESGAFEARGLPAFGIEHFHPFKGGHRLIFDREIPVLQLNLAEQAARKGIVATSPEGLALGREIRAITGEINAKTMNINPNTLKAASRALLAPGFTFSKYKTILDAFTSWGAEHGAAGNLARTAVIGKSAIIGVAATLGTLLATGKFPTLQQVLMNFTFDPRVQTNFTNPKGRKIDITFPKTFLAEGASAVLDPVAYGNARLNPLISDILKLYTNKDYYDRPLVDPNVKTSTALQLAENLGIGHLPIGAQAVINTMLNKQTKLQGAISIGGLGTRVSQNDPIMVKYAGIDHAIEQIKGIAPDDPDRLSKMQTIFNSLPPDDRKSLAYQELLNGVSTKGIYQSEVERKYFEVQDLLKKGDLTVAAAITKAMSKRDYQTYKSIKTRLAHEATFQKVRDLVSKGDMKGATALTGAMSKQEYGSYQTWKKNNPTGN